MENALRETSFEFPNCTEFYRGKVRDVYYFGEKMAVVTSDRISAFDHILPIAIPFKGQVLNKTAIYFLNATEDIVENWLVSSPHANVAIGHRCEPIKLEMVVRGYLAGHAARVYSSGERILCGVTMLDGMKEGDRFPSPIITPATKAEEGHDEDISEEEILVREIVTKEQWDELSRITMALFQRGTEMAMKRGLILVDTKYEFGLLNDKIILIDEIHTPDSSRYYIADGYEERQERGEKQKQLSKEFVREWLMDNDFQGKEGQIMPDMPDSFITEISERYIELYNLLTGDELVKDPSVVDEIRSAIESHI